METPVLGGEPHIAWGMAARALEGQAKSGDRGLVQPIPQGFLIAVVDGLGHGPDAAAVSDIAVSTLQGRAQEPILSLWQSCHDALKGTRGVVMSLATIRTVDNALTWAGVGNVEGLLLREARGTAYVKEQILTRGGVLGYRLPPLRATTLTLEPDDLLIFASDGIRHGFAGIGTRSDPPQRIADRILAEYGKATDDALVLVVRYLGEGQ